MNVTRNSFTDVLKKVASSETSSDPENWSEENPLWGHCAVATLLAQDYFGGELIRGSLENIPKYKFVRSHFWNRFSNGEEVDFTAEQFSDVTYQDLEGEARSRESVIGHPDTARRYTLLKQRFESI